MTVRRAKPYVCVDCDFAEHFRFQATADVEAAAGTWLRCLAHSRAQEQDGLVTSAWLSRTFAANYGRVEDLIKVGLLRVREDGEYQIHAYAPRNQTSAMIAKDRQATRKRVRAWRRNAATSQKNSPSPVTPYSAVTSERVTPNERRSNAAVPISTSISTSSSLSSASPSSSFSSRSFSSSLDSLPLGDLPTGNVRAVPRAPELAPAPAPRPPLPPSERAFSGSFWVEAFRAGISEQTGRACSVGRFYLGALERIVGDHAPHRDAPRATGWLKDQAKAFAADWDGKHPAKGLTPDGLERWLNDGRPKPPVFGRLRIVQPPAEQWHEDDWSDLGAKVDE